VTAKGVRVEMSRPLAHRWAIGFFAEASQVKLAEIDLSGKLASVVDYTEAVVGWSQTLDWRNDPLNTETGWIAGTTMQLGVVDGTPNFREITARASYYQPIGMSLLAVGLRGGKIIALENPEDVPLDKRFYLGGSTTVRIFEERELGPRTNSGTPVGGDSYMVANIEWQYPVAPALYAAAFVDAGILRSALAAESTEVESGGDDLRFAIGVGIRYKLPIGPLRIDYGVNPNRQEGEAFGAFHFSFGFAF
jgi:outer membrane protein assembly factor BamA